MFRSLNILLLVLLVSACATLNTPSNYEKAQRTISLRSNRSASDLALRSKDRTLSSEDRTLSSEDRNLLFDAAQQDYEEALSSCAKAMDETRRSFSGQRTVSVIIAAVGIIAGSIIVPALAAKAAASKAAIAAWGGVSGAANAGQYMLDSNGLSPFQIAAVHEQMREEIKKATDAYVAATDPKDKALAVNALVIACQFQPLPTTRPPTSADAEKPAN